MVSPHLLISNSSRPCTNSLVTVPIAHQLQLALPSLSCSAVISVLQQGPGTYLSFCFLSDLPCDHPEEQNPQFGKFSFSCWLLLGLIVWPKFGDPFVSQNSIRVCTSHSPEQMLGCAYTICSYGHILISCTIPSRSPCPPSRIQSYTLSVLVNIIIIIIVIIIQGAADITSKF